MELGNGRQGVILRGDEPWHVTAGSDYWPDDGSKVRKSANAALIADAPFLACEVERLRELCGELVGALKRLTSL